MSHLVISQKQCDQICVMLESLKPEFGAVGSRDVEVRMRRDDVDLIISTLAALTQPASPALKLPEEASLRDACHAVANATHESLVGSYQDGWNACITEAKRLNAPHKAPIEPICATGGAEWVKVSDKRLKEISDCDGFMPENQEVFSIANELLAVRSTPIPDEFLNAQQNATGMFEISEDCMCQLLNMLCSKPIDNAT